MPFDVAAFAAALREILAGQLATLVDFKVAQFELALAEGWRCNYPRAVWARENAPAPHLNAIGRRYMEAEFSQNIFKLPGSYYTERPDPFLMEFWDKEAVRATYRNFLKVGTLDLEAYGENREAMDYAVNRSANHLLEEANRHVRWELEYNRKNWYVEAMAKATLTPPPRYFEHPPMAPVRDPDLPLSKDTNYWIALYRPRLEILDDIISNMDVMRKPHCTLELMRQLAPDFPFAAQLSVTHRLVFVQPGDSPLAWAVIIEKASALEFRHPPTLALVQRSQKRKLKDGDVVFYNVVTEDMAPIPLCPRDIEMSLLFYLPRMRRLIDFYQPFVQQALTS